MSVYEMIVVAVTVAWFWSAFILYWLSAATFGISYSFLFGVGSCILVIFFQYFAVPYYPALASFFFPLAVFFILTAGIATFVIVRNNHGYGGFCGKDISLRPKREARSQ